jgi:putative transposase
MESLVAFVSLMIEEMRHGWQMCALLIAHFGYSGKVVDAVIWMARTGSPWRDLSPFFGKWNSVWKRFRRWAKAGVWERILAALADDPDLESLIIDGTIIRAHQHAAGGKGGFRSRRSAGRGED